MIKADYVIKVKNEDVIILILFKDTYVIVNVYGDVRYFVKYNCACFDAKLNNKEAVYDKIGALLS